MKALLSLEPRDAGDDVVEPTTEMPRKAHSDSCGAHSTRTFSVKCFDDTCT